MYGSAVFVAWVRTVAGLDGGIGKSGPTGGTVSAKGPTLHIVEDFFPTAS
jgi:hypothetical protein